MFRAHIAYDDGVKAIKLYFEIIKKLTSFMHSWRKNLFVPLAK